MHLQKEKDYRTIWEVDDDEEEQIIREMPRVTERKKRMIMSFHMVGLGTTDTRI